VCTGRNLAEALAETDLPVDEAQAWRCDWLTARKAIKAPAEKRQSSSMPIPSSGVRAERVSRSGFSLVCFCSKYSRKMGKSHAASIANSLSGNDPASPFPNLRA
jgi:hypothetical protein